MDIAEVVLHSGSTFVSRACVHLCVCVCVCVFLCVCVVSAVHTEYGLWVMVQVQMRQSAGL